MRPRAALDSLLIVRLGAVGDGLMLAPALACLREAHPSARIDVTGIIWRLRLLAGPTLATAVRPLEDFVRDGVVDVTALAEYEHVVVFAIDLDDPLVRALANAVPERTAVHQSFPITRASKEHVIDHVQRALSAYGIAAQADHHYRLPVPPEAMRYAQDFVAATAHGGPRVYVVAGTKIATKCWPPERFVALCRTLRDRGWQVYLGCGPLDDAVVAPIMQGLAGVDVVAASGQDLISTAGVLAHMDLCVGVDSGITQLAALVGAPTLALFGPTRPELWGPVGPHVRVLRGDRGLACCGNDHPRVCEGGCMLRIEVEQVAAAAADMLKAHRG